MTEVIHRISPPKHAPVRRCVVKVGSALITSGGNGVDHARIQHWADEIAALRASGVEVVLVSSGAVAEGMARLGLQRRPSRIHELQAAAAVGQMGLIQAYERAFAGHQLHTAQILLTHDDLSHRRRYLNARTTLKTLLLLGVVPVVNENDTVVTDEIRFGDNDRLAGLVTNLVEADLCIVLTDQTGLFERDPSTGPAALIGSARADDRGLDEMASAGTGNLGRGGMRSKLAGARIAARSGAVTAIADGRRTGIIQSMVRGDGEGTRLYPADEIMTARKRWLAGHLRVRGELTVDAGASRVLRASGGSLLPVGVVRVGGNFARGELVSLLDEGGHEVARGLTNYSLADAQRIIGCRSDQIKDRLGYEGEVEIVHRDNMVLM